MVLVYIGIAIGVLITIALILKVAKTNPREFIGINTYCKKCGTQTINSTCPKCEKKSQSFGV